MTEFFAKMGISPDSYLATAAILVAGTLVTGILGRFIFGKRSDFSGAVSSAIAILFIYAVTVVLRSTGAVPARFIAPLPFITLDGQTLSLFQFQGADYTVICSNLLSMVILAFTVNVADRWLAKGKNIFSWFLFRVLTVAIAYGMHLVVVWLFTTYLPEGLVTYAPTVLLALLIIMLLTGALKIIVGVLLSTVDPIIGGLYTFFFATIVGRMVSKAVLTTLLLALVVFALNYIGITAFSVASAALSAYIPLVIALAAIWYVQHKCF